VSVHPLVQAIEFFAANQDLASRGLVAWVHFNYGGIRFHAVELRRTLRGDLALSWPRLRTDGGKVQCATHPVDDDARRAIEAPIIEAARRKGLIS
jgi:hypothetical protein